jgi:hypothetical protein
MDDSKTCAKCGFPKPIGDFAFKDKEKNRRHSYCSECMKPIRRDHYRNNTKSYYARSKARKEENRKWLLQLLSGKCCVDCGENDPIVLDFDHVRGVKSGCVSQMLHERSKESVISEIEKCEVRCANCHRRKTARERGWYKFLGASANG